MRGTALRLPARVFRRHRKSSIAGLAVILAGIGLGTWSAMTDSATPVATTTTETVSATTLRQTVSATGTLESANEADLSFGSSGQVTAVQVEAGDTVKKGQPLATITSASLSAAVAEARVSVASAQSRMSSDESAGASSAQLTADQQSLTVASNNLTDAQQALDGATMTAPFDGTVASVDLAVGQQVSGSGNSGSSGASGGGSGGSGGGFSGASAASATTPTTSGSSGAQIVLIDPAHFNVSATVDDTDIALVKKGLQATITPNGASSVVYGTVSSVGVIASSTSGVTSYPVTIAVTGAQQGLHPGASASVLIVVKQLTGVIAIPTTAISYVGNAAHVTRLVAGRKVDTAVTVGTASGAQTQITKGLAAGDTIVVPQTRVTGGGAGRTRTGDGFSGGRGGNFPDRGFSGGNFPGGGTFQRTGQ